MTSETAVDLPELPRHVPFENVFNFRDLGGYATADGRLVRWRTLWRADGLHRISGDDLVRFGELGIRTVVDLRTDTELEEWGRFWYDGMEVHYHHLPVIKSTWDPEVYREELGPARYLADRYLDMLDEGRPALGRALELMTAAENLPLVFHCAAGKDRTGVLAALTLSLLGVPEDDIARDYSLSRPAVDRLIEWYRKTRPPQKEQMAGGGARAALEAPEDAMHLFLADLRGRYGSVEPYAEQLGLGRSGLESLRANLLVAPA